MARFTDKIDGADVAEPGDRILSTFLTPEYYHFALYSLPKPNTFQNIEYGQLLEGQWNYIYFSYDKLS